MINRSEDRKYGLRPSAQPVRYSKADYQHDKYASQAMREVEKHMGFIFAMVLYDKFDWGMRKIANCQDKILSLKKQWFDYDISSDELIDFAEAKKDRCKSKSKGSANVTKILSGRT